MLPFLSPGKLVTELLSLVKLTRVKVSLLPAASSGSLLVLESLTFLEPWGLGWGEDPMLLTECLGGWWRRVLEVSERDMSFRTALGLSVPLK